MKGRRIRENNNNVVGVSEWSYHRNTTLERWVGGKRMRSPREERKNVKRDRVTKRNKEEWWWTEFAINVLGVVKSNWWVKGCRLKRQGAFFNVVLVKTFHLQKW